MKKNIIVIIAMIYITNITFAQNKAIKQFYKECSRTEASITKFNIRSWMVGLGKLVIKMGDDGTDEMKLAIKLTDKINRGKFMAIEKTESPLNIDTRDFVQNLRNDHFEDLISIRDKGTKMNIMIQEVENTVKQIIFLVNEPDNFVMMSIETDLSMDELNDLIQEYNLMSQKDAVACNED